MATVINVPTFRDERGALTVIDKVLPFEVMRIFYIYDVIAKRGGHGHVHSKIALIALNGSVQVYSQSPKEDMNFLLDTPDKVLVLEPDEWHTMDKFSKGAVLLVLCSHHYDENDYFYEPYRKLE